MQVWKIGIATWLLVNDVEGDDVNLIRIDVESKEQVKGLNLIFHQDNQSVTISANIDEVSGHYTQRIYQSIQHKEEELWAFGNLYQNQVFEVHWFFWIKIDIEGIHWGKIILNENQFFP